jgi:four helix bundle protein
MQNYKSLKVWEKSHAFTLKVYAVTRLFPKEEIYSLTNQVRRSSASIPANIAEGCGKNSRLEMAHFLNTALGSANESEYFLILSKDLQYLSEQEFNVLYSIINEIKSMLISLISKIRAS